jgi:hypothetical protein
MFFWLFIHYNTIGRGKDIFYPQQPGKKPAKKKNRTGILFFFSVFALITGQLMLLSPSLNFSPVKRQKDRRKNS